MCTMQPLSEDLNTEATYYAQKVNQITRMVAKTTPGIHNRVRVLDINSELCKVISGNEGRVFPCFLV